MLRCAQEELSVKKRMTEQIHEMDRQYAENMSKMSQNMEKLANSVEEGFSLLKAFMFQPPRSSYQPQSHYHQYYPGSHSSQNPLSFPASSSGSNSCPHSPYGNVGGSLGIEHLQFFSLTEQTVSLLFHYYVVHN